MGLPGDDRVAYHQTQREPAPARRFGAGDAEVIQFRRRRESLAERLEREGVERERAERQRRTRIERDRAARERAARERWERRRKERAEWLRREREAALRHRRPPRRSQTPDPRPGASLPEPPPTAPPAQLRPRVQDPFRKRKRAVQIRRRVAARRRGLFWPTAKAGFAVTVVLGLSATLGSVIGLPVPGLDTGSGGQSLSGSAPVIGLDPGTPTGLGSGYVYPVGVAAPHDYGEAAASFGAERYGHTHVGQDVFASEGTPLFAVRDGIVIDGGGGRSFYAYGGGNSFVMYSPEDNRSYVYLHMLNPSPLHAGQRVHAGQRIGQVGCTGSCDGPHLHFEIRLGRIAHGHEGKPIDPLPFLRQWERFSAG